MVEFLSAASGQNSWGDFRDMLSVRKVYFFSSVYLQNHRIFHDSPDFPNPSRYNLSFASPLL